MSTQSLDRFQLNSNRLKQYLDFSRTLDLESEPLRKNQSTFFKDNQQLVAQNAREKALASFDSSDSIIDNEFWRRVAKYENEIQEELWTSKIDTYHNLRNELALVQLVTIVEVYINDCLKELLLKRPKLLLDGDAKETVTYKNILEHNSYNDLIATLVDRKITKVMRKSIAAMLRYLSKSAKNKAQIDENKLAFMQKVWETRNLIVHQNSEIDSAYAERYGCLQGERVPVDDQFVTTAITQSEEILISVDLEAEKILNVNLPTPQS